MFAKLNNPEKLAAIGIFKFIVTADGKVTEDEIEMLHSFIEEKSFHDFTERLDEYEEYFTTLEDFIELLAKVKPANRSMLAEEAFDLAIANGYATPEEMKIFDIMADIWEVDKNTLLGKATK